MYEALLSTASRVNSTGTTPASPVRRIQPTLRAGRDVPAASPIGSDPRCRRELRRPAVGQTGGESNPHSLLGLPAMIVRSLWRSALTSRTRCSSEADREQLV